jgi:hypothetical protein
MCHAETDSYSRASFAHLERSSFSVVHRLHAVAESRVQICHADATPLQCRGPAAAADRQQAAVIVHDLAVRDRLDLVTPPVDVLWFFQVILARCRFYTAPLQNFRNSFNSTYVHR